jgi:hypothetical protein
MTDLAVIHGGIGAVLAAAMAGKPLVCVGMPLPFARTIGGWDGPRTRCTATNG